MHVSFIRILTNRNALPAIVRMIVTTFQKRTVQNLRLAFICMDMLLWNHADQIAGSITTFCMSMRRRRNRAHQRQCITVIHMRMILSYRTFQILSWRITKVRMFMTFSLRLFTNQFTSFQGITKIRMNM